MTGTYWLAIYDKEFQHRVNTKEGMAEAEAISFCTDESNLQAYWIFLFRSHRELIWTNKPMANRTFKLPKATPEAE